MMMKINFLAIVLILLPTFLFAQKHLVTPQFGIAKHLANKAFGYSIGVEYQHKIKTKHNLGVSLSYVFAESRGILPNDLKASNVILRDFTNIPNLPNFGWSEDAFPTIRLKAKPDIYFNFNLGVHYFYDMKVAKNNLLKVGIGGVITFRDEKLITELVKAKVFKSPLQNDVNNLIIPIFQYDSYIDLGLLLSLRYEYALKEKLVIGCNTNLYLFPKSKTAFWTLTPFIGFKF